VAIFILQNFFFQSLWIGDVSLFQLFFKYFALQPIFTNVAIESPISGPFLPWQIFTYMFMHGGFMHLFFNMFALWMFGLELENLWGSKKFLFYYMLCGVGAAFANLFIAPFFSTVAPTIGASGSVYGILVAFGYLFPNRNIYIYFLLPIKAKYLVVLYMILELFSVASSSGSGIAHVAHLGGAVVGILYLILTKSKSGFKFFQDSSAGQSKFTSFFSSSGDRIKTKRKPTFGKIFSEKDVADAEYTDVEEHDYKKEIEDHEKEAQEKIDAILDKLSASGYQSLTVEEKRILFQESKKLR
jgi:membrane associated rhomboid family serine protease